MMYKTLLIDGHNLAWRAGSVYSLKSDSGNNTSVIYGSLNMIRSLLDQFQPVDACICWDLKSSKKRLELFPEYKGHRRSKDGEKKKGLPEEIVREIILQIGKLQAFIKYFGMKQVILEGVEADDSIAVLADYVSNPLVVSTDKDMLQLVEHGHHVYSPFKDKVITPENFEQEMGIKKELFLFWRTIIGDASDGIPGIRGVGEKTGKKLLDKYGDWLNWLDDSNDLNIKEAVLEDVNKAQRETLKDGRDILVRNYYLMKLGYLLSDLEVEDIVNQYKNYVPVFDDDIIETYFKENQFDSYLQNYNIWTVPFRKLVPLKLVPFGG